MILYNYTVAKRKDKKTVLVGGCFDLLHYGHFTFLKKAAAAGDRLVVALESDEFIKTRKKKNPIHTQRRRAEILRSLKFIGSVVLLPFLKTDEEYFSFVKKIKPDIIAVTEGDPNLKKKQEQARKINAKIKVVTPLLKGYSTNEIILSDRFTR